MNAEAPRLGMTGDAFRQSERAASARTSTRRRAILPCWSMAIRREFPQYARYFSIEGLTDGGKKRSELQSADRPLSRRRRHEDGLRLRLRLQHDRLGDAQRPHAGRGRARRQTAGQPRRCIAPNCSTRALPRSRRHRLRSRSLPPYGPRQDQVDGSHRRDLQRQGRARPQRDARPKPGA